MKLREWGNFGYHLAGAAAMAAPIWVSPWFIVLDTAIWATLREQAQHRYIITGPMPHLGYPAYSVEKRTFFDFSWLTRHSMFEIGSWTLGAAILCGVFECFVYR